MVEIKDVIPESKIWLVSPHYDDIPLTFGGLLDSLKKSGVAGSKTIRIVHVFSRSCYQNRDHEGNKDTSLARIKYATGIRLMEDLCCLDDLLGFGNYSYEIKAERECVVRQKAWKEGEKFEFPLGTRDTFDDEDWEIFGRVKGYAKEWLTQQDTALLLPLSVKQHVDHMILREALMDARDELGDAATSVVYFGEDEPYTGLADEHDWEVANAFIQKHALQSLDYTTDVDRKAGVIETHYPSQVEASYLEGIRNRSKQLAEENGVSDGVERVYRMVDG